MIALEEVLAQQHDQLCALVGEVECLDVAEPGSMGMLDELGIVVPGFGYDTLRSGIIQKEIML